MLEIVYIPLAVVVLAFALTRVGAWFDHRNLGRRIGSIAQVLQKVEINTNNRLSSALTKIDSLEAQISRLTELLSVKVSAKVDAAAAETRGTETDIRKGL